MAIAIDETKNSAMVDEELPAFIDRINKLRKKLYESRGWSGYGDVYISGGHKYVKLAYESYGQTSVYCFVRACDGKVLKAATWKAPALNFARASIFDAPDTVPVSFTEFGPRY